MYINDICNASTSLKFILFADDTNVFYSGVDIQTICECISRELDKLHVWLSVNKLSLNVDKTNFILFGNRKNIDNVYCSLFLPYLTYCAEIWGNTYKSNTQCIFLLQKKIVRIVYGANFRDHTDVIFQDLKFLKFYDLVKLKYAK